MSPLLYVLCAEALACQIRDNPNIEGFLLPRTVGLQYRVGQFADDTTSFVKDYRSLVHLFMSVHIYELGSGAELNLSKTEAMWLGAWRSRTDQPLGLTWVKKMKILGVFLGENVEQDNWSPKFKKLESHLNLWKHRSLSLVGRALFVNALGLSKLNYLASILNIPDWVKTKVNQIIWPFVWNKKFEPVARQTCYCSSMNGGLGIVDFITKIQALKNIVRCENIARSLREVFLCFKIFFGRKTGGPPWGVAQFKRQRLPQCPISHGLLYASICEPKKNSLFSYSD